MANKDLFKQAIAEAKSVREAAITNAKSALEESLTPHLKELLAVKLQEMEEEDKFTFEEAEEETPETEMPEEEDDSMETPEIEEEPGEGEEDEDISIEDMTKEDLRDFIKDVIAQEIEGPGGEIAPDEEESLIGGDEEDLPGEDMVDTSDDEEEINIDELLAELSGDEPEDSMQDTEELQGELNEAVRTIKSLRKQLQEVNLLNAKLLYVNKIFKSNTLTESQKASIIAAFDRADTVKEAKLVYESVSIQVSKPVRRNATAVAEARIGLASKATGLTAKRGILKESNNRQIVEQDETILRMQKLAGIIK